VGSAQFRLAKKVPLKEKAGLNGARGPKTYTQRPIQNEDGECALRERGRNSALGAQHCRAGL